MCEPVTLGLLAGAATGIGTGTAAGAAALGMTSALSVPAALAMGASVAGTAMSAGAAYQQGQVAKQVAANNAQLAEYAAQDAARRGEEEAQAVQRRGAALKSAQRVSLAAKGLDLTYGTPADLQEQTDFFTQADVATTRSNAAREAWSMRARGENARQEGAWASREGTTRAAGTLLAGAGQVSDRWYRYTRGGSGRQFGPGAFDD